MNSFFSITTFSMYINNCFIHNSYPPQICSSIPYKNPPVQHRLWCGREDCGLVFMCWNYCEATLLYSVTLW